MKILVTGAAGFIGSHFCEKALAMGHHVTGIDNFNDFYSPDLKEDNVRNAKKNRRFKIYRGDILDEKLLELLFRKHAFNKVVHLAARAGVRPSLADPLLYERVNVEGTIKLLLAMKNAGVADVVIGSSSSVYGINRKVPFSENDPLLGQISPYAVSKRAIELHGSCFSAAWNLNVTCLRFFTVYGPRGRPDMAVSKFIRAIDEGEIIEVYGGGSSKRDYTYIDDIVAGVYSAMLKTKGFDIFNLGDSRPIALRDMISTIETALDKKAIRSNVGAQQGDVKLTFADISKARKLLRYRPKVKFEEGIRRTVLWYLQNKKNSATRRKNY